MYHLVKNNIRNNKKRIKLRIRSKISGTSSKPRLSVYRSNKFIYGQLIDDTKGNTLLSIDNLATSTKSDSNKSEVSYGLGKKLAELAIQKGISEVVFDRNRYIFHGRVAMFAKGARDGGLKF